MKTQFLELQHVPVLTGQSQSLLMQKRTVSELSDDEMIGVDGGTDPLDLITAAASALVVGYYAGKALYYLTHSKK